MAQSDQKRQEGISVALTAESVKGTIKAIDGCSKIKIYRSTLIDNPDWKKLAGRAAPVVPDNP